MSAPSTLAAIGDASGNVLIVDDFPDTLALYEAVLSEDGHKIRTASSGVEALRMVDELEPELVLLDVSMPGLDGVEVLRRLRGRRGGGPAVIMLTAARREPHAIEAGLKEGADAYLTKPIDSRELDAAIRLAASRHAELEALEAEVDRAQQALEDRKLVERAKGLLMTALGLSEQDAFRRLQLSARERNLRLADVARRIVEEESLLAPGPPP